MNKTATGILFALAATIVWSGNFIVSRGMAGLIPPVTLAALRWGLAFVVLCPIAAREVKRDLPLIRKHIVYFAIIGLTGISYFNTIIYLSGKHVAALNMSLISATSPLFVLIMSRIVYGTRLSWSAAAGIAAVLCGVVMLVAKGDFSALLSLQFSFYDLLMLSGAFCFAVYTLLLKSGPKEMGSLSFLWVSIGMGLVPLVPLSIVELCLGGSVAVTGETVWSVLYVGIGASLFSFWAWGKAIVRLGPGNASIIYYSLPFFCGLGAVIFRDEPVTVAHCVSGAMILGGLVLATLPGLSSQKTK